MCSSCSGEASSSLQSNASGDRADPLQKPDPSPCAEPRDEFGDPGDPFSDPNDEFGEPNDLFGDPNNICVLQSLFGD